MNIVEYAFLRANGCEASLWPQPLDMSQPGVRLISAFDFACLNEVEGALFINFDSFVEMDRAAQSAYFDLIAATGADLLSVNHEAARHILDGRAQQQWNIARITELGLKAGPRRMFWEREGYVSQAFKA